MFVCFYRANYTILVGFGVVCTLTSIRYTKLMAQIQQGGGNIPQRF